MNAALSSAASELLQPPAEPRLIEIGVRSAAYDAAVIEWAVADARPPADMLRFVHAYAAPEARGLPRRGRPDERYHAALELAQSAVRVAGRRRGLHARAVAIARSPVDALVELSDIADLVVVGDDSVPVAGATPRAPDPLCWRVQDRASCPVVSVPPGPAPAVTRPVTVVVDDAGVTDSVLDWAAERARHTHSPLQVARVGASLQRNAPLTSGVLAELQQGLDEWLSAWLASAGPRVPRHGVAARVATGDAWLHHVRASSSLVVASVAGAASVRHRTPGASCPTAIVPLDR